MKRPSYLCLILSVFIGSFLPAFAESESVIKARMLKRLPSIVALAQRGAVGEGNQGVLVPRGTLSASEKAVVNAENADRKAVYALIARKTGAAISSVARQRAAQIRGSAPRGTWIQKVDGTWVKAG